MSLSLNRSATTLLSLVETLLEPPAKIVPMMQQPEQVLPIRLPTMQRRLPSILHEACADATQLCSSRSTSRASWKATRQCQARRHWHSYTLSTLFGKGTAEKPMQTRFYNKPGTSASEKKRSPVTLGAGICR